MNKEVYMGLFDKLKNVFFEEEEVEVEENERESAPVAKKIDVLETKKKELEKENSSNKLEFEPEIEKEETPKEKDFKFPMGFDDKDFEYEKTIEIFGPMKETKEEEPKVEEVAPEEVVSDEPTVEEPVSVETYSYEEYKYEEPVKEEPYKEDRRENYHKLYEAKEPEEKTGFTPSPIISPIYGILNKNYKKEEIVSKSDLKKSESVVKKDDLDIVREKAYGDLASEISSSIEEEIIDIEEDEKPKEKKDLLYDLNDEESPTVKTVTVGDAEEYFNDLGLEYNVDYKVEKEEKEEEEEKEEKPKSTRTEKLHMDDDNDEDDKNLFDLIDAMYEDESKDKE
jgi:hypothetical protein